MSKKQRIVTIYRSSIDGKFVTQKEAERRPGNSEKEHYKVKR